MFGQMQNISTGELFLVVNLFGSRTFQLVELFRSSLHLRIATLDLNELNNTFSEKSLNVGSHQQPTD